MRQILGQTPTFLDELSAFKRSTAGSVSSILTWLDVYSKQTYDPIFWLTACQIPDEMSMSLLWLVFCSRCIYRTLEHVATGMDRDTFTYTWCLWPPSSNTIDTKPLDEGGGLRVHHPLHFSSDWWRHGCSKVAELGFAKKRRLLGKWSFLGRDTATMRICRCMSPSRDEETMQVWS